jgi:hypothetical protein
MSWLEILGKGQQQRDNLNLSFRSAQLTALATRQFSAIISYLMRIALLFARNQKYSDIFYSVVPLPLNCKASICYLARQFGFRQHKYIRHKPQKLS